MQLVTIGDGMNAVQVAIGDINTAALNAAGSYNTASTLPFSTAIVNSPSDPKVTLGHLTDEATTLNNNFLSNIALGSSLSDDLSVDQRALLKTFQSDVQDARSIIGGLITPVDWTFAGDVVGSAVTTVTNAADHAVAGLSGAFGINWTYIKIAVIVAGLFALVFLFKDVKEAV